VGKPLFVLFYDSSTGTNVRHNFFANYGYGIPEPSQREKNGCIFRVHSIMSISISEASPQLSKNEMIAKAQQINFESRVRLLTVLHEAYYKKKHTQMDHKTIAIRGADNGVRFCCYCRVSKLLVWGRMLMQYLLQLLSLPKLMKF
jgi:hypothetical protein